MIKRWISLLLFLGVVFPIASQTPVPEPAVVVVNYVEIPATDGRTLHGSFYGNEDSTSAVLLLHQMRKDRTSWDPAIGGLLKAGLNILAPDMRGFGVTGGEFDPQKAQADVQKWIEWLREQGINQIYIVGASIGANLGIIACAQTPECESTVAISPGSDFFGVQPASTLQGDYGTRPILFITSHGDSYSATSVFELAMKAQGDVTVQMYQGDKHGTNLFDDSPEGADALCDLIVWFYNMCLFGILS